MGSAAQLFGSMHAIHRRLFGLKGKDNIAGGLSHR
jgi:hypothetical protein